MGGRGGKQSVYERGMRLRLRDRLWEVQDVRGAGAESLLDLRRADDRPGPVRLTVVAGLEPSLRPEPASRLKFELGNPVQLAELHTALALTMAHGRGDLVAAEHGRIEIEPYQLVPVLAAMRQPRTRLLVADDVGLGKTIEAGLILLELARRGLADRVLIACPAGLQDQWVQEMRFRFNLDFTKVDSRAWLELRRSYPTTVSPWTAAPLAVSSIDYLKSNLGAIQAAPPFDVVLIDEAHRVARAFAGEGRSAGTDRSRLARVLADHCRELVLLSATPHNGYKESFASLLQLLSPHLAADDGRLDPAVARPYVIRRLKDEVARGRPPQPISRRNPPVPIEVTPTSREKEIHQRLRGHSQRVLRALRQSDSYYVEAFALEVLRKRALSSPHALLTSLRRRAANLGLAAVDRAGRHRLDILAQYRGDVALTEGDLSEAEELALSGVAAHLPDEDLHEEQRLVGALVELVERVTPGDDSKLTRLRGWLDGLRAGRHGERVIIFTAAFASALFGARFGVDSIIEETPVPTPVPDLTRVSAAPDPVALRRALADGPSQLHDLLGDPGGSPVLDLLRQELARPRTVDELVATLGRLPQRAGVGEQALREEVAGWLLLGVSTPSPAGPPVLEAKVHLFLRGMPKLTRCTGPGEHLLLNGATVCTHEGCPARVTYSLGICPGLRAGLRPGAGPRGHRRGPDHELYGPTLSHRAGGRGGRGLLGRAAVCSLRVGWPGDGLRALRLADVAGVRRGPGAGTAPDPMPGVRLWAPQRGGGGVLGPHGRGGDRHRVQPPQRPGRAERGSAVAAAARLRRLPPGHSLPGRLHQGPGPGGAGPSPHRPGCASPR